MSNQRYAVTKHPVQALLTWAQEDEIAIPEIQRPFVWNATKVRNLLDSLYKGYPVGYLIACRNPAIKLKDGKSSAGKRILIDGQQRLTALMTALFRKEVLTKDYQKKHIRIAFHPQREEFEVWNMAIKRNASWIPDIATVFDTDTDMLKLKEDYAEKNPDSDARKISIVLEKLQKILTKDVGIIELAPDLDIETVTEIFSRVNSEGTRLSQADYAMSKIAVSEQYDGHNLRKAIDYFCHLAVAPDHYRDIEQNDTEFAKSEFLSKMQWLKNAHENLYVPTYNDMLRVVFTSRFKRGKLQDLVALLSGRNFETQQYEEAVAEDTFNKLRLGVLDFINKTHFGRLTMILRSTGFLTSSLTSNRNAVNFAYILYLLSREKGLPAAQIERLVRRWYAMSLLTRRYSKSSESIFDHDIRAIESEGPANYVERVIENELSESFWVGILPQAMKTSSSASPYFLAYQAAQVRLNDKGFLSQGTTVRDLLEGRNDKHHVFPQKYLLQMGFKQSLSNQIANLVVTQNEPNIAIGAKAPELYFAELGEQCRGGKCRYGGITSEAEMRENLKTHCIPDSMLDGDIADYEDFLELRRKLMAQKIKAWFELLSGDAGIEEDASE